MCRNIKKLRRPGEQPTDQELHDAALQFVRKLTGYRVPSRANQEAFDAAITDIAAVTRVLFERLVTRKSEVAARQLVGTDQ
ncbi:MAG: DUF2277 domain-containing protein [Gemmatimonadota bacterium]|nr:MAG: DUF2277 domain-containing protein [Gemmatimonadota bacterium]